jgi:hypothetical protein
MSDKVYGSISDPYCYDGSTVLINRLGIKNQNALNEVERQLTSLRFEEPIPQGNFDVAHYCGAERCPPLSRGKWAQSAHISDCISGT